jgi:hypothetical protein
MSPFFVKLIRHFLNKAQKCRINLTKKGKHTPTKLAYCSKNRRFSVILTTTLCEQIACALFNHSGAGVCVLKKPLLGGFSKPHIPTPRVTKIWSLQLLGKMIKNRLGFLPLKIEFG